jgi:hypothetical protein
VFPSRRVERQQTSSVFSYKWKRKKMRKGEVEKRRKQQQDTETPSGGPSLRFASCKSGSFSVLPARDGSSQCARLPSSRVPRCTVGGSALQEPAPRLVYVFVFECEMCKRDLYAHFRADAPELDFELTCPCGWAGTRRGAQAKKVFCQHADSPLPKA